MHNTAVCIVTLATEANRKNNLARLQRRLFVGGPERRSRMQAGTSHYSPFSHYDYRLLFVDQKTRLLTPFPFQHYILHCCCYSGK
jgi:hypothetical protein